MLAEGKLETVSFLSSFRYLCGAITVPRLCAPPEMQTWVSVPAPRSSEDRCFGSAAHLPRNALSNHQPAPPGRPGAPDSTLVPGNLAAETARVKPVHFGGICRFLVWVSDKAVDRGTQLANTKKGRKLPRTQTEAHRNLSAGGGTSRPASGDSGRRPQPYGPRPGDPRSLPGRPRRYDPGDPSPATSGSRPGDPGAPQPPSDPRPAEASARSGPRARVPHHCPRETRAARGAAGARPGKRGSKGGSVCPAGPY